MTVQKWIMLAHIVQPEVYMLGKQKYADANNGLSYGRCAEDAWAVLKKEGVTDPRKWQINKTLDKLEVEHHAIIFINKSDWKNMESY